ncbi:LrgA [Dyella jiangningensis]|uniref:LrgA n=1 Tax=Dyella jiangningensis TaxID=1379159 RepID=UPI00240FBB16|nr:LrgA [Dyella jiangningensis]MDG2536833.1 LrgA [Dyella jiangningensis]
MSNQRWDKVELAASYTLLTILATELLTRLGLVSMFEIPTVDLVLSIIATVLVLGAFWFARHSRKLRFAVIAVAAATQLVPMVIRQPVLLLPLIGAAVPVGIMLWAMIALSKKGQGRAHS